MEISSHPDELFAQLYPDVSENGSLRDLLNHRAQQRGFALHCDELIFQGSSAVVRGQHGNSQIYLGAKQRFFIFDFWQKGVMLAQGAVDSPQEMMLALHRLIVEEASPVELNHEFPFVKPSDSAVAYLVRAAIVCQASMGKSGRVAARRPTYEPALSSLCCSTLRSSSQSTFSLYKHVVSVL